MRIAVVVAKTARAQESLGQQLVGGGGSTTGPRARGDCVSGGLAQDRLPLQAMHSRGYSLEPITVLRSTVQCASHTFVESSNPMMQDDLLTMIILTCFTSTTQPEGPVVL